LRGDSTSLNRDLQTSIEHLMPGGTEVTLDSIEHLADYEQPLVANFKVKGQVGSATGKRMILPGDLFEANSKPSFPHENRTVPVYFEYSNLMQDAVRFTYPSSFTLESQPASEKVPFGQVAAYSIDAKTTPNSITVFRNLSRGFFISPVTEYPALRSFYTKLETKDQEPIVLKSNATTAGQ
jgi:hypothetical protein